MPDLGPDTHGSTDNLKALTGVTVFPLPGKTGRLLIAHVEGTAVSHLLAHSDEEEVFALEYLHSRVCDHECALVCGYEIGSDASAWLVVRVLPFAILDGLRMGLLAVQNPRILRYTGRCFSQSSMLICGVREKLKGETGVFRLPDS